MQDQDELRECKKLGMREDYSLLNLSKQSEKIFAVKIRENMHFIVDL